MRPPALAFAVAALAASATAAGTPAAPRDAAANRCRAGAVPATIGGSRVCLYEGATCRLRHQRQYRRHVLTCRNGYLDTYWRGLRRPWRAQPIGAGAPCPTTSAGEALAARGFPAPLGALPAWGRGPAYPTGLGLGPVPALPFEYPPPPGSGWEESGWGGNKNIWVVAPSYHGPVLVRGRQLDGPNEVRLENGRPAFTRESALHPSRELRLQGPETHGNPSTTRLRAPGCYAFQVDGRGFSYAIVFEARLSNPLRETTAAMGRRCGVAAVPALVAGRRRCLVEGAPCRARLNRVYHRYAFQCRAGSLGYRWRRLRRPLHVPALAAGRVCPASAAASLDFARYGIGTGFGPGPAYPIFGGGSPRARLDYVPPAPGNQFAGSDWGGQKVLWFVRPSYPGPVLIRGRQLDGPDLVRFDRGVVPPTEIRIGLLAAGDDLRDRPSFTRVRAPGCYGYQIDGIGFSRVIVFEAKTGGAGSSSS